LHRRDQSRLDAAATEKRDLIAEEQAKYDEFFAAQEQISQWWRAAARIRADRGHANRRGRRRVLEGYWCA